MTAVLAQTTGEGLMALGGIAGMIAVAVKLGDFWKLVTNLPTTTSALATQLLTWIGAIGIVFVYAASDYADGIGFGDTTTTLANANGWTKLIIGIAIGSAGSILVDFKKARDNNDSAKLPSLPVGPPSAPATADITVRSDGSSEYTGPADEAPPVPTQLPAPGTVPTGPPVGHGLLFGGGSDAEGLTSDGGFFTSYLESSEPTPPVLLAPTNEDSPVYVPAEEGQPPPPPWVEIPTDENDSFKPSAAPIDPTTF